MIDVHIGDLTAQILLVGHGVILRHGEEFTAGEVIDPGVADMGPEGLRAIKHQDSGSGFHVPLALLGLLGDDLLVGGAEQGCKAVTVQGFRLETAVKERVCGKRRGHLPALVAAQAVRHHKDTPVPFRPAADAVLIMGASAPVGIGKS